MPNGRRDPGYLGKGILFGFLFTLGGLAMTGVFAVAGGFYVLLRIGVAQVLWMGPAWLHYRNKGETETAKGILVIAGIVFLLNATCWGMLMGGKIRIGG